jgi:FAD dependent oxidoreductase TIGR03364
MPHESAIVIGAGIVGLAMARSLAVRGVSVTVFERNEKAVGASIRNFGMLWPIGQPDGPLYERALRSKSIWKAIAAKAGLWYEEQGSLHLAYSSLEWQVLNEFAGKAAHRQLHLLNTQETLGKSEAVNPNGLRGGLFSGDEMIIESRVAMEKLPAFLTEQYGVQFHFGTAVTAVEPHRVYAGIRTWSADRIFICSGADFQTLYPEIFAAHPFTKCKLQMLRLAAQPGGWRIGPSLGGGLSLIHYKSFETAASLPQLKQLFQNTMPDYLKWGIHVMVSQNGEGELTVGDSHEYGAVHDPFDKQVINELILDYLKRFACFKEWRLLQTWNGIYPKRTDGAVDFIHTPEPGVTLVNGLGGAGMTLSFGLAEEVLAS